MLVHELITSLQELDPQAEVRIASQPQWPFEHVIDNIVQRDPPLPLLSDAALEEMDDDQIQKYLNDCENDIYGDPDDPNTMKEPVVYIAEGKQIGYLPGVVKTQLEW